MTDLAAIPLLCREALCIAGNPIIGAVISSFFNKESEYFCLLEPPRMNRPDYLGEVIKRNNIAARLKPKRIILAALENYALSELQQHFSPEIVIVINSLSEVQNKLEEIKRFHFDGEITCNPKEISYGLLLAKTLRKRLTIDENAPSLENELSRFLPRTNHLIIVEDSKDYAPIIAANYAFSLKTNLKLIPSVTKQDVDKIYDELLDRRFFRNSTRGTKAEMSLKEKSEDYRAGVLPSGIDFITFVTSGVPYGYFFPDTPSTHLFSYPDLGLNIFAGIYYSYEVKATRSAVIIDPGHFKDTESNFIEQSLKVLGTFVKSLRDDKAKVYNVRNHITFYPYDLLYICAHAGEMGGKRLKIKFLDRHGASHIITIDHAAGFGPTGEGGGMNEMIEVLDFRRFVELDGIDWGDSEGKAKIGAGQVVEDFANTSFTNWEILESNDIPYVKDCVALKLTDHYCLMAFSFLGHFGYPIVFNNACVSFYNFSELFIFAGARAYIGTLSAVDNQSAKVLAEEFFRNLTIQKPLPLILWEVQKRVYPDPQDRTYVHVGCHFTNVVGLGRDMASSVKLRLIAAIEDWTKQMNKDAADADAKQKISRAIKFLTDQLASGI